MLLFRLFGPYLTTIFPKPHLGNSVNIPTVHEYCRNNKKIGLLQRCSILTSKTPTHQTASRLCEDYSRQPTRLCVLKKIRRTRLMGKNHWYYRGRLQGLSLVFSHFSFRAPNSRSERFLIIHAESAKKPQTSAVRCRWCEAAPTKL